MLGLLGKLMKRTEEVNDGSFEIDERETEGLRFYNEWIRCCKVERGLEK